MSEAPENLRFTEAAEPDVAAISTFFWEMWDQAGPDAPGFAGATEDVIAEIAEPEAIRVRIGGPDRRMFLAYQGNAVVGFAATRTVDEATVELAGIVVLQTMVGRGIGSPLVAAAVEFARKHGFEQMTVSTETTNKNALDFYRGRGFSDVGESIASVEGTEVAITNLVRSL